MDARRWAIPVVAALLVAGCTGTTTTSTTARPDPLAGVTFGTMIMRPTPAEPFETPGDSIIAWGDAAGGKGLGFLSRDAEAGLYIMTAVVGGRSYSSNFGLGWIVADFPGPLNGPPRGSSLLALWDLPTIARDPAMRITTSGAGSAWNLTAEGILERGGQSLAIHLEIGVKDGQAVWARMEGAGIHESPFIFRAGGTLPFPIAVPVHVATAKEAAAGDAKALDGHNLIKSLIKDYADRRGSVPDDISPQSLQVERLAKGNPDWPTDPFTGQPMHSERISGNFVWTKCSSNVGRYDGYGWDTVLTSQSWNSNTCGTGQADATA